MDIRSLVSNGYNLYTDVDTVIVPVEVPVEVIVIIPVESPDIETKDIGNIIINTEAVINTLNISAENMIPKIS